MIQQTDLPRRRSDSILVREMGEELVVLDTQADRVHQLNYTAAFIWRHCDDANNLEELAALLVDAFDVTPEVALEDTIRTLGLLLELKLLNKA